MSHSKGTWKYVADFSAIVRHTKHEVVMVADFGKIDNHVADAKLMAESQELLKAAKQALEIFEGEWPSDDEIMGPVMKEFQALINKAEGVA